MQPAAQTQTDADAGTQSQSGGPSELNTQSQDPVTPPRRFPVSNAQNSDDTMVVFISSEF